MPDHEPEVDLPALMPADTPAFMFDAWISALHWALGDSEVVEAFRAATGNAWRPAADPLGRLIDTATGAEKDFLVAFVAWFNKYIWGPIDGPPADAVDAGTAHPGRDEHPPASSDVPALSSGRDDE